MGDGIFSKLKFDPKPSVSSWCLNVVFVGFDVMVVSIECTNDGFVLSEKYPLAVCVESGLVGVGGSSNGVCSKSSDGLYGVTI